MRRAWGSRSFALNFIQCGGSGKDPAAVVRLCSNWGAVCGWQQTQPAVDSALRTLPRLRPFLSVSRCTKFPESRLFIFNLFPGFNYAIIAVRSRTFALKRRTKFIAKFVRGLNAKKTTKKTRGAVGRRESRCMRLGVPSARATVPFGSC